VSHPHGVVAALGLGDACRLLRHVHCLLTNKSNPLTPCAQQKSYMGCSIFCCFDEREGIPGVIAGQPLTAGEARRGPSPSAIQRTSASSSP
jgi:hypothetical protein